MSRIIPLLAATLLLGASGEAAERPATGRSVSAQVQHATPDARKAWFEWAVGDILDGHPRSDRNGAGRRAP